MKKENLVSLSEASLSALTYFAKNRPTKLNLKNFKFPLVVGSGNAYNAGQVIFGGQKALFANESEFKELIKNYKDLISQKIISDAVIISASGEKDSTWEVKLAKKLGMKTSLMTCSPESSAAKLAESVFKYNKLPEPYTYNTSTYLGMILSATLEDPKLILRYIKSLKFPARFRRYESFAFILPDKYSALAPMLEIKRNELFGPKLSLRACTEGEARHAKFVIRDEKELVISFSENLYFGHPKHRWEIKLPKNTDSGLMMALTYFIIGQIQECKPDWFGKNIYNFCNDYGFPPYGGSKPFEVIVK
ncbi:MAG: hypothetical protein NT165_00625 [Candidatus Falkowbacteria bacterium]|nr:hypothetical protein [Candidatus Falkowbacteria bacterium]